MKVAAIDIGSNSIHMIVAEVGADHGLTVVDREKDMVKLGAGAFATRRLTDQAVAAGLHSLRKMKKLCERYRVDDLVATATSAVREAENGGEFLSEIERQTGIKVEVITGEEEARLIYLAVRSAIDLRDKKALIIDIGGGSVEAIVGGARDLVSGSSFRLGVQRLRDRFAEAGDPLPKRERKRLEDLVRDEAGPALRQARDLGFDFVVGTSGTILSMGELAHAHAGGKPWVSPNNERVKLAHIEAVNEELAGLDAAGRARLAGVDQNRVDTIHLGGILIAELLKAAGADEITLCTRALREGLVLDYLDRNLERVSRRDRVPDIRRRSILELLARSGGDERVRRHHHHVARLALAIFDHTHELHGLGAPERQLLQFAALVHDIGGQIAFEGHERHSYYLIRHADLRGFTRDEIEMIALLARYHRGPSPKRKHREVAPLPKRDRRALRRLAAILRVADGLDRSHFQTVRTVRVLVTRRRTIIGVEAAEDAELEMFTAKRKGALFERVFDRTLVITHEGRRPRLVAPDDDGPAPGGAEAGGAEDG